MVCPLISGPMIGTCSMMRNVDDREGRDAVGGEHPFLAENALEQERRQPIGHEGDRDAGDEDVRLEPEIEDGKQRRRSTTEAAMPPRMPSVRLSVQ